MSSDPSPATLTSSSESEKVRSQNKLILVSYYSRSLHNQRKKCVICYFDLCWRYVYESYTLFTHTHISAYLRNQLGLSMDQRIIESRYT